MQRSIHSRRSSSAFTLIELLVVVAIIAILAAILFPVFAQAKAAAKKTQSLSNIKNLGTATLMYLGDSDDRYSPVQRDGDNEFGGFSWWGMYIFPYVKNREGVDPVNLYGGIYRDPSHPKPNQLMHYGMNYDIQETSQTQLDGPADKMLYGEKGANGNESASFTAIMSWEWLWTDTAFEGGDSKKALCSNPAPKHFDLDYDKESDGGWAWPYAAMLRYRVNRTGNLAFADGHAKSFPRGRVDWCKNVFVAPGRPPFPPGPGYPY